MTDHTVNQPATPCQAFPDPIPGIIPFGSLCLFAGASGVGKTIMQAEWCARWRDGRSICGHQTNRPTGFYYLAADRDWSTYAAAFAAAGFPEIIHYALADDPDENPARWDATKVEPSALLDRCLLKLNPCPGSLTIIDPIAPLFIRGDQNRAKDVAISMHYLRRCGRKYQTTFLCDANVAKQKNEEGYSRAQDRISGSGAFIAYTDTQIYMAEGDKPGDPRILGWTPRRHAAEEFKFQFDPTTQLFIPWHDGFFDTPTDDDRPTQLLSHFPEDEAISVAELTLVAGEQLHLSRATLHRYLDTLRSRGLILKTAHGQYQRRKVT